MLRRAEEVCRMGCDAMRRGRREGSLEAREGGRRYVMRTADEEKRGEDSRMRRLQRIKIKSRD